MSRLWHLLSPLALTTLAACSVAVEVPQATDTGTAATTVASVNFPAATVISVGDGDTMRINYQGQTVTLRMACIDTPETDQVPWGQLLQPASGSSHHKIQPFSLERLIPIAMGALWPRSTPMARTLTSSWYRRATPWSITNSSAAARDW